MIWVIKISAASAMAWLLLFSLPAGAEIYKWVDAQGTTHYSDKPVRNAKKADLPGLQGLDQQKTQNVDLFNGVGSGNASSTNQSENPSGPPSIALTRPLSGETFRDGRGLVATQVAVSPELSAEQALIYYLDGTATPVSPTQNTAIQLEGVPRGEHQISVAVVSAGKEIVRSPPVVFYMQPPAAISPLNQSAPRPNDQRPTGAATATPSTRSPGSPAAPRFGTQSGPAGP